jgi:hypothetical protein
MATEAAVEFYVNKFFRGELEGIWPDHNTQALVAVLKKYFDDVEVVADESYSDYEGDGEFVSVIEAKIGGDGKTYRIVMCAEAGSILCYEL